MTVGDQGRALVFGGPLAGRWFPVDGTVVVYDVELDDVRDAPARAVEVAPRTYVLRRFGYQPTRWSGFAWVPDGPYGNLEARYIVDALNALAGLVRLFVLIAGGA